jgi:hypothetical protein
MGLVLKLQDEWGDVLEEIADPKDLLGPYIPPINDESYHCLRFIDRYGDTYFNRQQIERFKIEWERLAATVREDDKEVEAAVRSLFEQVSEFARKCQREPHLYIKFEGD